MDETRHIELLGDLIQNEEILSEVEAGKLWPEGKCTICDHMFSEEESEGSPNCPECESRPRARTLPILMHYIEPLTRKLVEGELLAFAKTGIESKYVDPAFNGCRSVSLFGDYGGDHEMGVDIRDLSHYSDGEFCGSFSCLLFDYFPEHSKALSELGRVIYPGGIFITHIANYRLLESDEEPFVTNQIEARGDYFDYLGENTIPSIKVGKKWFFNAIRESGFSPGIISVRDSPTGENFLWFLGLKNSEEREKVGAEESSQGELDELFKLQWDPVDGAESYRVLIRDDNVKEISVKDVVQVTEYDFCCSQSDSKSRFRYRIQHRISLDDEWIDGDSYSYITPPQTSQEFQQIIDFDMGPNREVGATRIIIRDDTENRIIQKDRFSGEKYILSWKNLDLNHSYRYRFQYLREVLHEDEVDANNELNGGEIEICKRVIAVYGLKSSGGLAIQDWLSDYNNVIGSKYENYSVPGIHGFRELVIGLEEESTSNFLLDFVRTHGIGATVPMNRNNTRNLSQYREDLDTGILPEIISALGDSLDKNHYEDFIRSFLCGKWSTYLNSSDEKIDNILLVRKIFTQGNFEMLGLLPPFRGVLVWRDPRDQYIDLVRKNYGIERGDVEGFVEWYLQMMKRLASTLNNCSDTHRRNILHIPFGRFVKNESFRGKLAKAIGATSTNYVPKKFIMSESLKNIGLWKEWKDGEEIEYIERRLGHIVEFCNKLEPFNIGGFQYDENGQTQTANNSLDIVCSIVE